MTEAAMQAFADDEAGEGVAPGDALHLADLVSARLCHDLSGLLGTLLGALEMTIEDTAKPGEALLLADEAAQELGLRLRLLRAAWGGNGAELDAAGLAALAPGLSSGRRVQVDVAELEGEFPAPVGRVLLNLMLLGAEALPGGGVVTLTGRWPNQISMSAEGPRLMRPGALTACLAGAVVPPASARDLQVPLTFLVAAAAGATLSSPPEERDRRLTLRVNAAG